MPRARLTDAEREARRRERARHSFSDAAYKHYNPDLEGFGSVEEWVRQAETLIIGLGGTLSFDGDLTPQLRKDLAALFLDRMPSSLSELKTAFRNSLFVHHPDHGGSNDAAREALDAFKRLSRHF